MLPTQTIIDQINNHYTGAMKQPNDAVESARAAVEPLFQAKANLPQGTWIGWLTAHLSGSDRQSQRYMAAAEGQPVQPGELAGRTSCRHILESDMWNHASSLKFRLN
jgi:hypothetical protein